MPEAVDQGATHPLSAEPVVVLRVDDDEAWAIVEPALSIETQQRIAVIQRLLAAVGTKSYGKVQQRAAKELGISVRSLQRLVKQWRERGIAGLDKQLRSDCGVAKISCEWQEFVVKTYRDGNRGSQRMSRAQVWLRVKVRAAEQGSETYPSRTTVYRVLKPYIEKQPQVRSLGWRGDRITLKTSDGLEIPIEWSNQVLSRLTLFVSGSALSVGRFYQFKRLPSGSLSAVVWRF
jgi:putative transposase